MNSLNRRGVGLASCLGLVALVVGVPYLLVVVRAAIFPPGQWEFTDVFSFSDNGTVMIQLFWAVAWGAWAYLTWVVAAEVWTALTHRSKVQVTGVRLGARRLVGAAALLFVALPATAGMASASESHDQVSVTQQQQARPAAQPHAGAPGTMVARDGQTAAGAQHRAPKHYHVYEVRGGDTLSQVTKKQTGHGGIAVYTEVVNDTNAVYPRPTDPNHITDPDIIRVGQKLVFEDAGSAHAEPAGVGSHAEHANGGSQSRPGKHSAVSAPLAHAGRHSDSVSSSRDIGKHEKRSKDQAKQQSASREKSKNSEDAHQNDAIATINRRNSAAAKEAREEAWKSQVSATKAQKVADLKRAATSRASDDAREDRTQFAKNKRTQEANRAAASRASDDAREAHAQAASNKRTKEANRAGQNHSAVKPSSSSYMPTGILPGIPSIGKPVAEPDQLSASAEPQKKPASVKNQPF